MREFRLDWLFTKKTMKGYPKVKKNLEENPNGYYVYGQNIQRQHPQKILMDEIYLHRVDPEHPILAYISSVGEIGLIDEDFYRSGDNGAFQGLFPKDRKYSKLEVLYFLSALKKRFADFGYTTGMSEIMSLTILLPIQTDAAGQPIINPAKAYHLDGFIPDWDYMAAYIRAIEKLVIKDVVDFKNAFIAGTTSVVTAGNSLS